MTTLIIVTIVAILGVVAGVRLEGKYNHISIPIYIFSIMGLIACLAVSLANPMRDDVVKTFSPSQLTIETTPYRVIVTPPLDRYKEFVWKDAYTVSRAKDIVALRVTIPVNAWGITLDSQPKVELLFSNSTAPEATSR